MVNLSSIVHSRKVRSTVSAFYKHREGHTGPTTFNLRQLAREHDINDPYSDLCTCRCSGLEFIRPCNYR